MKWSVVLVILLSFGVTNAYIDTIQEMEKESSLLECALFESSESYGPQYRRASHSLSALTEEVCRDSVDLPRDCGQYSRSIVIVGRFTPTKNWPNPYWGNVKKDSLYRTFPSNQLEQARSYMAQLLQQGLCK